MQPVEMSADRPGLRNSSYLVGVGVAQLENGLNLSSDHTLSANSELRVGALRWLEFRVLSDEMVLRSSSGTAGTSDLSAGIKVPLLSGFQRTRVAAILKSTLPTGHSSQTTGGYEPGAELIWKRELTEDLGLAGTWNLTRLKRERFLWQRAASVSVDKGFGEGKAGFAEVYVFSPVDIGAGNRWGVNAGLTRTYANLVMLDASAGHSVHGPKDWFVMLGFSMRSRVPSR